MDQWQMEGYSMVADSTILKRLTGNGSEQSLLDDVVTLSLLIPEEEKLVLPLAIVSWTRKAPSRSSLARIMDLTLVLMGMYSWMAGVAIIGHFSCGVTSAAADSCLLAFHRFFGRYLLSYLLLVGVIFILLVNAERAIVFARRCVDRLGFFAEILLSRLLIVFALFDIVERRIERMNE